MKGGTGEQERYTAFRCVWLGKIFQAISKQNLWQRIVNLLTAVGKTPIVQLVRQITKPEPGDLNGVDLSQYKGIEQPLFDSWSNITRICEEISVTLGDRLEEFERYELSHFKTSPRGF